MNPFSQLIALANQAAPPARPTPAAYAQVIDGMGSVVSIPGIAEAAGVTPHQARHFVLQAVDRQILEPAGKIPMATKPATVYRRAQRFAVFAERAGIKYVRR